jgi:glycine cleavage system T protein (aminomethyltransferase)
MPIQSPFHERTAALCTSHRWKDWAGYLAVCSYGHCHEKEYFAFRESAGLIDVTPLYKYEVIGPDAARLLSRMMVKDISKLKLRMVTYCCWCDDAGKMIDDGTVTRMDEDHYRLTSADPSYHWLQKLSRGLNVAIEDSSRRLAAVALQGPNAREILRQCCDVDVDGLKFFRMTTAKFDGFDSWITRTGYTGDLGYEIWVESVHAIDLWDRLMAAGHPYGILPAGLDALDMTRIEAGFVMMGVDYLPAPTVTLDHLKSSPYEAGLGWCVNLEREDGRPFIGQAALRKERSEGSVWQLMGLEIDRVSIERLYERHNLPAALPAEACRQPLPLYRGHRQVGQVTSSTWSPLLKKFIALATVETEFSTLGCDLEVEHTVEYERCRVKAQVQPTMFFNPERKRSTPGEGH